MSGENKKLIICLDNNKIVGTLLLTLVPQQNKAYISYLTRHSSVPKEQKMGSVLMKHAENKALNTYKINKIWLSIVYHPQHTQERLEKWYTEQGYLFLCNHQPDEAQQQAWQSEYRKDVYFKYFEKNL